MFEFCRYGLVASLIAAAVIIAVNLANLAGIGVKTTIIINATTPCAYPADFARKISMPTCAATVTNK